MIPRFCSAALLRAGVPFALAGLLAACHDTPTVTPSVAAAAPAAPSSSSGHRPPGGSAYAHRRSLAQVLCTVQIHPAAVACADVVPSAEGPPRDVSPPKPPTPAPAGGARRTLLTLGGQHHFVRLTSGAPTFTAADSTFAFTVSVQSLVYAPLGTSDGTTPHASGVRVFFTAPPSDGVTVDNATGTATFMGTGQAYYFQYSGAELGPDGILSPDETSAVKTWRFETHGAATFTFTVYVQAEHPAGVAYAEHFTQVSIGTLHSCGLTAAGKAYCWGRDFAGQLGNGASLTADQGVPSAVDVSTLPAGVTFAQISAGSDHTCAIGSDGKGYCWGSDTDERLGNGAVTGDQASPSAVSMTSLPAGVTFSQISAGSAHTCAIGSDGKGYCWGSDFAGRLGNGATFTSDQASPSAVDASTLPAGVTFTQISAGSAHTCAIGSDAKGYCWGSDDHGRLGNGAVTGPQVSPSPVTSLPAGVTFTQISTGNIHTCAIGSDGNGYCWGPDINGRLGDGGLTTDYVEQLSPSAVSMPAGVTFVQISAGYDRTCALGSDGDGYCWGSDSNGELGNGPALTADQASPSAVSMPAGVAFSSIQTARTGFHSCASASQGLYCWGHNPGRQLGDGTVTARNSPVVVAGSR